MKKLLFLFFPILSCLPVLASHIIGGEMIYEFIKADSGFKTFRLTLRLFRDEHCANCATMPAEVYIGIFNNDTKTQFPAPGTGSYFDVQKKEEGEVTIVQPPCILNAPALEYHVATYVVDVTLPDNQAGYTASYQTCCRVAPIQNAINEPNGGKGTGSTYACFIPGLTQLGAGGINNSPQFINSINTLCQGRKFTLDFSATDPDGDVLKYKMSYAYNGGRTIDPRPVNPDPPAYVTIQYTNGYSFQNPLGSNAEIDENTGVITGIAPPQGDYVVCVEIAEYRNGIQISVHRKDFIINVSDCDVAGAALKPGYVSCDDYSHTFENLNNSALNKTFLWDFGDGTFSKEATPTHAFTDTGTYNIKLIVNEDGECGESATSVIKVYPGFYPDFSYTECENNPTKFKDLTRTRYGAVSAWSWSFGEEGDASDTSHARNPVYTYPTAGKKEVVFAVGSSKGCVDTITKEVLILGNAFAGQDTTVVAGQPLQFEASDGTAYSWQPGTDLSNPSIQNPVGLYRGNYDSIRYKVLIYNGASCVDSAFVTVHIYKTAPQIFVPTAFTPNGDGRNDVFKPVAAGIGRMTYFRVFNRWGQLVYAADNDKTGWDGKLNGKDQASGTFVWLVKGIDYLGKPFFAKGTVLLIR